MICKTYRLWWAIAVFLALPSSAWALVDGEPHALYASHRVFGRAIVTGNTLMSASIAAPEVNSGLLPRSAGDVRDVPFDGRVVAAYLFWSGSIANQVDRDATLFAPGGERIAVGADRCVTVPSIGGFFYCRADVSDVVIAAPGPQQWNGRWEVGDVRADPGTLDRNGECVDPRTCQAKYAGWSLVLVYEADSARTQRDVFIHDGFRQLDETPRSPGIDQFDIRGFDFPANGQASVTIFGMEGDPFLGVPPQDTDPVFPCQQCFDFFEFRGTKLGDANNPPNNLFNSSSPGGFTLGVDIDTFDVSALLRPGDQSVRVRVGSGDGIVNAQNPDPSGGGESFFLGFVLLNVDRNAPNFRRDGTILSVVPDEGAPRERVVITLAINNEGTLDARNTIATLALPAGLTYFPGSLRVDGADPIPGEEAVNPLEAGLRLGNIPFQGDSDRTITLRATIAADAVAGQRIRLRGSIASASLDEPAPTNVAVLTILGGVDLGLVFKSVADSDGDDRYVPGEIIQYAIRITNPNGRDVNGVRLDDRLPPYLDLLQVVTVTGIDRSRPEENRVILDDVTVPAEGETRITIIARIHDSEQLRADGVPAGGLNGLAIANRALVEAGGQQLRSDDPDTAAVDATTFRLSAAVDITGPGTVKIGEDVNGGLLEPGDRLRYTLRVENTGSRAADVFISDPLPPAADNDCQIESDTPNVICANGRLQGLLNVGAGATGRVVFSVAVDADAVNGTRIQNIANVRATDDAGQQIDVSSNILRVIAAPVLGQISKDLIGLPDRVALPGERLRYEIRVPNTGNRPATAVQITDTLPNFAFAEVIPGDGGVLADGAITWNLPNIAPGGEAVVTFEALLPPMVDNGTVISNQAQVNAAELRLPALSDDPTTAAANDATRLTVRSQARLVANKAVDAPTHRPGEQAVYRFTITNTGTDAAQNVVLRDVLPVGVFADIVPVGGRLDGGAAVFDAGTTPALANVSVGDEIELVVRARLLPVLSNGLIVSNQANIVGDGLDARPSNDPNTPDPDDATRFTVRSTPVLTVTKAVTDLNGGQPQPGDRLRYTFVLTNSGDGPAESAVLDDPVPASLTDVAPSEGGVIEGDRVIWRLADPIVPGAPQTVILEATITDDVAANTLISNQAALAANGLAPVVSDDPSTPAANDPTQIRVVRRPDFATSTKTADVREVLPGDLIRWTLTVTNSGAVLDGGVSVFDAIPAFLEVVDAGGGRIANGEIRWALLDFAPGESRVLTVITRVLPGAPGGTALRNQARIVSRRGLPTVTDDPDTAEDDDPTVVTVREIVLIEATKIVADTNEAPVRPGDTLVYTIQLTNRGTVAAQKVGVRDVLPAGLTVLKAAGADIEGNTLLWQLARLGAGETREFILTARVDMGLANGTRLPNQAQISAANLDAPVDTDDPNTGALGDPTVVQVVSAADFSSATKAVEPIDAGFRPGNRVRYSMAFTNIGDGVAENARVVDVLPPQLTEIESDGAIINGQRVTTQLGDVAPGETRRVEITARLVAPLANGTLVSNQGLILARGFADPFVTDDPATPAEDATSFTVVSEALPTLSKTIATPQPVRAGDVVEYLLTVGNDGDATATGLLIRDPIPAPLVNIQVPPPARVVDGAVEWLAPDVAPGETTTLTIRATVPADTADGARVVNRATGPNGLASDDPATPEADGTAFVVQNRADLARLSKSVIGDFEPGGRVTYTITLENRGNLAAQAVELVDVVPAGLTNIESDPPGVLNGGSVTWGLAVLAGRAEATFILRGTVGEDVNDGAVIANQARASADNADQRLSDDPATDAVGDPTAFTVRNRPELELVKTVRDDNGGEFSPGDSITYTLSVTNTGNREANFVTLQDRIPPGLENANALDGAINDGIAVWQIQTIPVDATRRFELRARVAAVPDGTIVVNAFTAQLRGEEAPITSAAIRFTVRTGTLTFEKLARPLDPAGFAPGSGIEYQLRITNPSAVAVNDIFVEDQVPVRFLQAFEPSDGGVFDAARQVIEWSPARTPALARIAPGQTVLLTIRAQIRPSIQAGDLISNQAQAVPRGGESTLSDDPTTPDVGDPTVIEVAGAPVYSVRKVVAAPRGVITAGAEVTYEIQVQNRGQVPGDAPVLVDAIPQGVTYVRDSTTLDGEPVPDRGGRPPLEAGVGLRGRNGQLEPGETATIRFTVRVPDDAAQGTRVDNQARVEDAIGAAAVSDDPDTAELNDPTSFVVGGGANVDRIIKTARVIGRDGDRAALGDVIEWTITVNNAGEGALDGLTLFDEIPVNSRYVPGSISVDGVSQTDAVGDDIGEKRPRAVVARLGSVPGRESRSVVFQTEVTAGPQVANQARVLRQGDPDRLSDDDGEGRDPTVVRVGDLPVRALRIRKTVTDPTDPPALAGEALIYRLNLTNSGTVDLADLTVVDDLQPGLVFVRAFDLPPNVNAEFEPPPAGAFQNGRVRLTGVGV
ncbi:MAG: putative repeat protein (TIGR01451 family), partial [Bradymonadia bacterium]